MDAKIDELLHDRELRERIRRNAARWPRRKPTMCAPPPCCASADCELPASPSKEFDGLSAALRIAFVSGHSRWWRKQRLVAKYFKMRLEGVIYPDVYCLRADALRQVRLSARGRKDSAR